MNLGVISGWVTFLMLILGDNLWFNFLCRTNIVEAHAQILSLLKSEYSPEDIDSVINMVSMEDLQAQLDTLL